MSDSPPFQRKRVLVVGASGFIGAHVVQRSQKLGHDVFPVGGATRVQSTPSDAAGWRDLVRHHGPFDACFNCAGRAHVGNSVTEPLQDFAGNTTLVFWLLDALRQHSPDCRFINISSAAVYGTPASLPVDEAAAQKPLSPYGWHKRISEMLCEEFAVCYRLKTCSLRGFSVYGPGLRKQLFWDLAKRASGAANIQLYGTGAETRDFIFIDDFVDAMFCALDSSAFDGECINVGSGSQMTIRDAANAFLSAIGYEGQVTFGGEARAGDPTAWQADISKLNRYGCHPGIPFHAGIQKTADWIRSVLQAPQR